MAIEIRDTEQVALTEPTPEERLYRAIEEFVDPETYDGRSCRDCLMGQVSGAWAPAHDVARRFGVPYDIVFDIYCTAAHSEFVKDLLAAKRMAREKLGLEPCAAVHRDLGDEGAVT